MKKLHYNAPVILTFFLISLGALGLDALTGGWSNRALFSVYRSSLLDPAFWLRLFGHVLGHADFGHFMNNMLLLLVVGPPMEEKYGSGALLAGIMTTAVVSGAAQCLFFPRTALLGASGIVFMLILLSSLSGMEQGTLPLTLVLVAALYLGKEAWSILSVQDQVANFMHILGGLCGTGFGMIMGKPKRR